MSERRATTNGRTTVLRLIAGAILFVSLGAPSIRSDEQGHAASPQDPRTAELRRLSAMTLADNAQILDVGVSAEDLNAKIPLASGPVQAMRPFQAIRKGVAAYDQALTCLTQAIYYEAANEPEQGKRAVAQVVLNRVRHPAYPASVCGVVYEGWNQPVCQFSFVCDGALLRTPMAAQWRQSRAVAEAALAGRVEASVGTATHYHADYVLPRWAYTLAKVNTIGRHIFYRFPGSGGRLGSFNASWSANERIPRIDLVALAAQEEALPGTDDLAGLGTYEARDPTDRRTETDVGGRIDPSKQWRLAIPDPVNASAGYYAAQGQQGQAAAPQPASSAGAALP
jgi:hypothetical protein